MARKIAQSYNVETIDVLTGFKYIGEKIKEFEQEKSHNFILGFEESYGYLAGTFVRDKDAVIASMLICEMAGYYKLKGMSLYEGLLSLYNSYGYYLEDLKSLTLEGIEGSEKIKSIMEMLRSKPPKRLAGLPVLRIKDYKNSIDIDLINNTKSAIMLPSSNVIQLILEDGSIVTARPSGTEPKIKFYFATWADNKTKVEYKMHKIKEDFLKMVE